MSERHEPLLNATCRIERHEDQPDDVTHVCRWLTHPGAVHNCNCGHSWEDTFEDRVMAGFAPALVQTLRSHTKVAECTCGSTYETYEGPQPDCPVHGAIRAYNEAQAELERLRTWAGLLELLDEHWPEDIFPTEPDSEARDAGPRIVSLLRWVERLRAELEVQRVLAAEFDQVATEKVAELARIVTEIEAEWEKIREAEGATARDESVVVGIYNGLGIALRIVRGES